MNVTKLQECLIFYNLTEQEERVLTDWIAGKIPTQKNILPRPVVRYPKVMNYDEKIEFKDIYSWSDWVMLFQEHIFCFNEEPYLEDSAKYLAKLITLCISFLDLHDYDEEKRSELFAQINKEHEERGYFKE